MFNFRTKAFISYLLVSLPFLALMFPFAAKTVKNLVYRSMKMRSQELIAKIQSAPSDQELVRRIKDQKAQIFFRVGIITDEQKILYNTSAQRVVSPRITQEYVVDHPEVLEAFATGTGYNEDYSDILSQKYIYLAQRFDFHGKEYVMRSAFPYKYVMDLTRDFELGFLVLSIAVLMLFTLMMSFIIHRSSSPIQQIITDITPYQEGRTPTIPEIRLRNPKAADDFARLASTLNSLSAKIQSHIDLITTERDEKEAILAALIEGVVAIDPQMRVTYANNMALQLLNHKSPIEGKNFTELDLPHFYDLLKNCQAQKEVITELLKSKQNGRKLYIQVVAAPKPLGGAVLVLQDHSSHYRMLEMRKDFVANASHELKTPITVIRGFAETLNEHPDLPKDTVVNVTQKIVNNCRKMTSLITDLLTLADIENLPESQIVKCDLQQLAERCKEQVLEAHPNATVDVVVEGSQPVKLTAAPHLLELAFFNLMQNAAKYSERPPEIQVLLSHHDDHLVVRISDNGIGIPAPDLEHIFQRFYTVDKAHSRRMGGSGLGLSIVETIVEKHLGRISVESEIGIGTTFTITLPTQLRKLL